VDNNPSAAAVSAMMGMIGTIWLIGLAFIALNIWFFWRIFAKAGYSGALSLLNLIPGVGNLVCILILAFGTWPNEPGQMAPVNRITPSV
jgi:uncharacterized membrane protein YhaH (DUF805 family)